MKLRLLAAGLALATLGAPAFAQNLLLNGDFESGAGANPTLPAPNWTFGNGGNPVPDTSPGVYNDSFSTSGNYFWLNEAPGFSPTLSQTFAVSPGTVLTLSGDYGSRVIGVGSNSLLLELLDASNSSVLFSSTFNPTPTNAWSSFNVTTPVINAPSVTIRFTSQVNGTDDDYKLDNLSVAPAAAPEPGTVALLGLVAPLVLRLRRRK